MVITLRNVSPDIALKLSEMAKKKHMSREQYIKSLLCQVTLSEDMIKLEDRYENLVKDLAEVMLSINACMEENNIILEKVIEKL